MVDEAFGLLMEDGASLEVALEFTKGLFDFEKVFVVPLDLRGTCPCDGKIGVGEIPAVVGGLGGGELGEGSLGFGVAEFTAFPCAVSAPWTSADDMALAIGSISMRWWASVSSSLVSPGRSLRRASRGVRRLTNSRPSSRQPKSRAESSSMDSAWRVDLPERLEVMSWRISEGILEIWQMVREGGAHTGLSFSEAWFQ